MRNEYYIILHVPCSIPTLKPHWKIEFHIHSRVGICTQLMECITCESSYSHAMSEYLNTLTQERVLHCGAPRN